MLRSDGSNTQPENHQEERTHVSERVGRKAMEEVVSVALEQTWKNPPAVISCQRAGGGGSGVGEGRINKTQGPVVPSCPSDLFAHAVLWAYRQFGYSRVQCYFSWSPGADLHTKGTEGEGKLLVVTPLLIRGIIDLSVGGRLKTNQTLLF